MVYLSTSEEWQRQSALLLRARPTTTRITTKYKLPNLNAPKYRRAAKRKRGGDVAEGEQDDSSAPKVPRAALVLKTYDHESGVVLKFKTDRAADVGRLVAGLGRLGRYMAALPEKTDAIETAAENQSTLEQTTAGAAAALAKDAGTVISVSKPQQTAGNKKKKKGKK